MLKRFEGPLKIVCLGLAALLVWQMANVVLTVDPLKNLKVPDLPTLSAATNAAAKDGNNGTNATVASKDSTNKTTAANIVKSTNMPPGANAARGSNAIAAAATNSASTNAAAPAPAPAAAAAAPKLPPGMTPEMLAGLPPEVAAQIMSGAGNISFNGPGGPGGPGGPNKMEMPKDVQARVDTIVNSEILGQVMHPMPMMLNGIADNEASIQATNGQSGWVKIGGEMGGVKLLRIGGNRVLVEDQGQKKELMMFGGLAGESLMPKEPPPAPPSTNSAPTNSISKTKTKTSATNDSLSPKNKETP